MKSLDKPSSLGDRETRLPPWKPIQEITDVPFFKDGKSEYAKDKEYLAINRFERPSLDPGVPEIPAAAAAAKVRDAVAVADKPLALAGRGFDTKEFPFHSGAGIEVDYLRRLKRPVPKVDRAAPDALDLQLNQAKSSKSLIFHPLRSAMSQLPGRPRREDPEFPGRKSQALKIIPETKLLFKGNENNALILRLGNESLDLLTGNEKINRKKYDSW